MIFWSIAYQQTCENSIYHKYHLFDQGIGCNKINIHYKYTNRWFVIHNIITNTILHNKLHKLHNTKSFQVILNTGWNALNWCLLFAYSQITRIWFFAQGDDQINETLQQYFLSSLTRGIICDNMSRAREDMGKQTYWRDKICKYLQ